MDNIPDFILSEIFYFLEQDGCKSVMLVCKHWYKIKLRDLCLSQTCTSLKKLNQKFQINVGQLTVQNPHLIFSSFHFPNLTKLVVNLNPSEDDYFNSFDILSSFIHDHPSLQILLFSSPLFHTGYKQHSQLVFNNMSQWKNITSFFLEDSINEEVAKEIISQLASINIKRLKLRIRGNIFGFIDIISIYLPYLVFLGLFGYYCKKIENLPSSSKLVNLKRLDFQVSNNENFSVLELLPNNFPNLKSIHTSLNYRVNELSQLKVDYYTRWPNLKTLKAEQLTLEDLNKLGFMTQLKSLNLIWDRSIDINLFKDPLDRLHSLTSLSLKLKNSISSSSFKEVLQLLKTLESLTLEGNIPDDAFIEPFEFKLKRLCIAPDLLSSPRIHLSNFIFSLNPSIEYLIVLDCLNNLFDIDTSQINLGSLFRIKLYDTFQNEVCYFKLFSKLPALTFTLYSFSQAAEKRKEELVDYFNGIIFPEFGHIHFKYKHWLTKPNLEF